MTISWPEEGNDSAPYSEVSPTVGAKLQGHEVKQKKESWNSSDDRFAIFTNITRPPAHTLTCATTDISLHIPGYSSVQGILCAAYS